MRRRRWRWLGVGVIVITGAFLALDVVTLQYLESRGAAEIARTMSAEEATVDLGGFPFVPRFLRGRMSGVAVNVKGATASGGFRVQSLEARMEEATFDAGELFALARSSFATRTKITATQPLGIMELSEQDLEDFIRRSIPTVGDVRVKGSGVEVRFFRPGIVDDPPELPTKNDLTKPARFIPTVVNRRLVLTLIGVSQVPVGNRGEAQRIETLVNLPQVPADLSTDVSLRDRVIVLEAQGVKVTISVGEGEPDAD